MAMFIELALARHARESESSLSLGPLPLVPHPKIEPRTRTLFIARVLGVLRHRQVPRAVPGSFCMLQISVVETAVEDEAVYRMFCEGGRRRAVHRVAAPRRGHFGQPLGKLSLRL